MHAESLENLHGDPLHTQLFADSDAQKNLLYGPQISAETYVGIESWIDPESQDTLRETMNDAELEIILANTNNELKCLILGALGQPRTRKEVYTFLAERHAFDLETRAQPELDIIITGFSKALISEKADGELSLTPFGQVNRAFAGHLLEFISAKNIKIEELLGRNVGFDPAKPDARRAYSQTKRLLIFLSLPVDSQTGLSAPDLTRRNRDAKIGLDSIAGIIKDLENKGFADTKLVQGVKLTRRASLSQNGMQIRDDLTATVLGMTSRSSDFMAKGKVFMEQALIDVTALPYLIRRYAGNPDANRFPTVAKVEDSAYKFLVAIGGKATTRQLYDARPAELSNMSFDTYSYNVFKSGVFKKPKLRHGSVIQGNDTDWELAQ